MRIDVIGVYPVAVPEPCHLIEIVVANGDVADAVAAITQEIPGHPRESWQVPYDEHVLTADRSRLGEPLASDGRVAFFFHYLDLARPLVTAGGHVPLPAPSPRPARLGFICYEPPC